MKELLAGVENIQFSGLLLVNRLLHQMFLSLSQSLSAKLPRLGRLSLSLQPLLLF